MARFKAELEENCLMGGDEKEGKADG